MTQIFHKTNDQHPLNEGTANSWKITSFAWRSQVVQKFEKNKQFMSGGSFHIIPFTAWHSALPHHSTMARSSSNDIVNWCGSSSKILNASFMALSGWSNSPKQNSSEEWTFGNFRGFRSKGWSFFEGKSDEMKPQCIQCSSSAPIYLSHKRWDGLRKILHNNSQRHHIHKISTEYIWILEHGRSFLEGS